MLSKLLAAWGLMALCVAIHAGGVTSALRWQRRPSEPSQRLWRWTLRLIVVAAFMIFLHLLEITVWAFFYFWKGAITDLQDAFYFSAVTYTTTGYGDVAPAR